MMRVRAVVRDLALLCLAVAAGWWVRGAGTAVYAQHSGGSSGANLAFQLVGAGPQQSLTVYNPDNRTLYVYSHINDGDSHVSCYNSFTLERLGGPIDRQNCAVGELVR
jgi:hypothetical protein